MANEPDSFPLGGVETHAGLLTLPSDDQLLYKIMTVENFIRSVEHSYLHFNRVDVYTDGPDADPHDSQQLPSDQPSNARAKFIRSPSFTAADYYDRARARTYACCFGLENADYLWRTYGAGGSHGKVGIVFDFAKLRARLNSLFASGTARIDLDGIQCRQIFHLNYGVVTYIDFEHYRAPRQLPNPIEYAYMKDQKFRAEREFRVTLNAIGIGQFALGGLPMAFPRSLHLQFDYRAAIADRAVNQIMCLPETDEAFLRSQLEGLHISSRSDPR